MRLALLAACATVAGCAAIMERQAAQVSSPALCYVQYSGNEQQKAAAVTELAKRGFVCTEKDIERGQYDLAQWQNRASRPAPSKPITCNTIGGTTTCY